MKRPAGKLYKPGLGSLFSFCRRPGQCSSGCGRSEVGSKSALFDRGESYS